MAAGQLIDVEYIVTGTCVAVAAPDMVAAPHISFTPFCLEPLQIELQPVDGT